jgi:hypothetical protein
MTIKAGSGSGLFSQRHGSEVPDPDPTQNIMDPQHCKKGREKTYSGSRMWCNYNKNLLT